MKKLIIIASILFSASTYAQITSSGNTYYVIAPTSGCNGVWAIHDSLGCIQYAWDPCFQMNHRNGDTLFLDLCSLPCNFYANTGSGDACAIAFCQFTTATAIPKYNEHQIEMVWEEQNLILKNGQLNFDKASVISINGQVIKEKTNVKLNENVTFDTNGLTKGVYIVQAFRNGILLSRQKTIKIN
jgi:hypothetical protein